MKFITLLGFLFILCSGYSRAQCVSNINLQHQWDIPFPYPKESMTAEHDQTGKPYLYVAGKERGLVIYSIAGSTQTKVDSVPVSSLNNLEVMSLTQDGSYLYLALGNFFVSNQAPGIAIVDVSNPANAVLKDVWQYPTPKHGAGIVKVEGDYAYLGAMRNGLVVLDISDKNNITYVSELKPDISYPNPNNPDSAKYNARGMAVLNSIVYLCYDAGGLRIIDATIKNSLSEIGHYSNPLLLNRPRAYNNLVLHDSLVYVAIDYCGMEVLNISNPSNITQVSWWNPWVCESPSNNWFNSPGHTNEIKYDTTCKMIFMSSGRSQVSALSVANPALPDSCTTYGTASDSAGSWGIGLYKDTVYAAYIFVPLGIPFFSKWGGIKAISWNNNCSPATEINERENVAEFNIYPNPSDGNVNIEIPEIIDGEMRINILDITGRKRFEQINIPTSKTIHLNLRELHSGSYIIQLQDKRNVYYKRLMIQSTNK